jgi:ABC-type amino acid transport system permease subunit
MNEIFPLASAAGMTVGLAVCALIIGLVLAMLFAVWSQRNGSRRLAAPRWSPCCADYRKFWWSCLSISAPHSCC